MTADRTIYIEQLHKQNNVPQVGKAKGGIQVAAHYGLTAEHGENKWVVVEKMVRYLRKMAAAGIPEKASIPEKYKSFEAIKIPGAVLAQAKNDPIDRDVIRKANGTALD